VIGLLAAVSLTTFVSLILLTHYLLQGGKAGGHPLIVAGIVLWATNVLIFGSHGHDAADHDGQVPDGAAIGGRAGDPRARVSRPVNILG
jgi:hypothetical protein